MLKDGAGGPLWIARLPIRGAKSALSCPRQGVTGCPRRRQSRDVPKGQVVIRFFDGLGVM